MNMLKMMLFGLALMWLSACGSPAEPIDSPTQPASAVAPSTASSPTGAVPADSKMPTELSKIRTQIQAALDRYMDAMNRGDETALANIVDQDNLTFKRVQNDFLKSPAYSWKGRNPRGTVTQVQVVREPYVKVWLTETVRGNHIWIFKWSDRGWLVSEPDEEELGARTERETDKFVVRYFEWDEALVDGVVKAVSEAVDAAVANTGRKAVAKFLVRMAPTFQTQSGRSGIGVAASYNSSAKMLSIRSPESFGGTFSGIGAVKSVPDIQHEFTHLLVDEAIAPRGTIWWVNEAFAHYFTDDLRPATVRASLSNKVYSLKDLNQLEVEGGVQQTDLYIRAQGTVAVQYMVEKLGGRDKAWAWLIAEAQIRDFNESFNKVFGVTYDQFEKGWQEFMKQRYGG
ncbi:MAG: hypothetical protein HY259_10890 [Chloroflexi bacterium]|nr:hypothetical protein [Chloroflexota bacterium]MBI3733945.1 hypothetical protein [Chloroflexota bacterium]